ncbi:MAG: BatA and WFA domain-containing protein [Bacteroidia bacterium]
MQFVYPSVLWGLLAVTVPIIIHLFNFRKYKKIYFTNVKLLKDIQHQSKSKSRLKEIIILCCRCLAIACLIIAFAQPFIQDKNTKVNAGKKFISIYIDNSFSSNNLSKQGPIFEIEKNKAREIIKSLNENDKIQIITNDFEGKHQRFLTKEDAISAIDELKISSATKKTHQILNRQTEFLNSGANENKIIYYLSDFQKSTFIKPEIKTDSTININFIPFTPQKTNNIFIDSCWFETPIQQKGIIQKLHVIIKNNGDNVIESGTAKLFINNIQIAINSYSIAQNSKTEKVFTFESKNNGYNYCKIKLEDYPITFDDELYFTFNSTPLIKVISINNNEQNSVALKSLFGVDSLFNYQEYNEKNINYTAIKQCNILILNELENISSGLLSEISQFINEKGSLIIIPNENCKIENYNMLLQNCLLPTFSKKDTLTSKAEIIETRSDFFDGVFEKTNNQMNLPNFNTFFTLNSNIKSNYENLIIAQNNAPILIRNKNQKFPQYLFCTPLNTKNSNFSKHALFVPIFYKMCFSSLKQQPLFYTLDNNVTIETNFDFNKLETPPLIKQIGSKFEFIPEFKLIETKKQIYIRNLNLNPGYYTINTKDSIIGAIAFNFNKTESDLNFYRVDELQNEILQLNQKNIHLFNLENTENVSATLNSQNTFKLWKLFLILSVFFILIESLIIRLLK